MKTVALKGTGVPAFVDALEKFWDYINRNGIREKQLRGRIEEELVEAAFSDFYSEAMGRLKNGREWNSLVGQVVERKLDPETAASKLVRTIQRNKCRYRDQTSVALGQFFAFPNISEKDIFGQLDQLGREVAEHLRGG